MLKSNPRYSYNNIMIFILNFSSKIYNINELIITFLTIS